MVLVKREAALHDLQEFGVLLDFRGVRVTAPLLTDPVRVGALLALTGATRSVILFDYIGVLLQCAFGIRLADPVLLLDTRLDRAWTECAARWFGGGT